MIMGRYCGRCESPSCSTGKVAPGSGTPCAASNRSATSMGLPAAGTIAWSAWRRKARRSRSSCRTGRRVQVVYDGLDEAAFVPLRDAAAVRAELGIGNDAPCVGVIGNIQE
jgi:hypothetical protein